MSPDVEAISAAVTAETLTLPDNRYPDFTFLREYWDTLRRDRFAPSRWEIDPVKLKPVLPNITLVEYDEAKDSFCFRLAGTGLFNLHNMEISYMPVSEIRPPQYRDLLHAHYKDVVVRRAPNAYEIYFTTESGLRRHYASLRVPLSDDGENVTGIMTLDSFCQRWDDLAPYFDRLYGRA